MLREFAESDFWICMDPAIFKTSKVSSTFEGSKVYEWRNSCRNWWRFHHISKLNKLAVMALICPRLYFFMAHQCRTWCPSSIGEGRGFSFLPPRETTIRVQQTHEIPGITAAEALSISGFFTACLWIKPKSEVLSTMFHTIPTLAVKKNKTTQNTKKETYTKKIKQHKGKTYASWKLVFSSCCASHSCFMSPWLLCRLDSSGDPDSALMSLMSDSMRKPAKPAGSFRS